jgi:hypothetical protein
MRVAGRGPELLRTLGWVLDLHGADNIEILRVEDRFTVSWENPSGSISNKDYDDAELAHMAVVMRQIRRAVPSGEWAERLRTLGQELEDSHADLTIAVQGERYGFLGLQVSARAPTREVNRWFPMVELRVLSEFRRRQRRRPPPGLDS